MALLHWNSYRKETSKTDSYFLRVLSQTSNNEPVHTITRDNRISVQKGTTTHTFSTNSKYEGTWDNIGMRGYGRYLFFYDTEYDGTFKDGMFNGRGTLIYPNNAKLDGYWEDGQLVAHRYFFSDTLCFGPYCEMPDRRFYLEIQDMLYPAGRSLLTNSIITREIPEGCYDTGDGFYDPVKKCVFDAIDTKRILRIPTKQQHQWIINNCRKAWDETVGFRPELFQNWKSENLFTDQQPTKKRIVRKSLDNLCYRKNVTFG